MIDLVSRFSCGLVPDALEPQLPLQQQDWGHHDQPLLVAVAQIPVQGLVRRASRFAAAGLPVVARPVEFTEVVDLLYLVGPQLEWKLELLPDYFVKCHCFYLREQVDESSVLIRLAPNPRNLWRLRT